eukprot:2348497-Lingulodinium_polyedra.AAC.1
MEPSNCRHRRYRRRERGRSSAVAAAAVIARDACARRTVSIEGRQCQFGQRAMPARVAIARTWSAYVYAAR